MHDTLHTINVLPIHVLKKGSSREEDILAGEELESLIDTLGGVIVGRIIQKLDRPARNTYIGTGKIEEVVAFLQGHEVDVVVLNAHVKPRQIHELTLAFQKAKSSIQVWDRVDLILQIFDKHAQTTEARLQIELARIRHMGPRIYGMGQVLSQQGGGIGTVGIGETNTELMKRHFRRETKRVQDELAKISINREQQLLKRKQTGFKSVSIVGYTNAGKSALFRQLSGKDVYVENELFATLDSSIGKVYLKDLNKEVLVSDTIGFIRDLPPSLISAFKSTLMESTNADLLLHVIDCTDPEINTKIEVVQKILRSLRVAGEVLYVFNKIDKLEDVSELQQKYQDYSPIFISARTGNGIDALKEEIAQNLEG